MDVAQARRIGRPEWLNLRTTLGLTLFLLALVGGQRVLQASRTTTEVWAAARDLPEGSHLTVADLRPVEVRVPRSLLARYATSEADLSDAVLTRPVAAGELMPSAWIASAATTATGRAITIPIDPEKPTDAALHPGDRVDVYATFDAGDVTARTAVLLRAAEVTDVVRAQGLTFGSDTVTGVTVSISPQEAARVAYAVHTADIDIARVTGAASSRGVGTVDRRDFP